MKSKVAFILSVCLFSLKLVAQPIELFSPDQQIKVIIRFEDKITFSISKNDQEVISASPISLEFMDGNLFGVNPRLRKASQSSVEQTLTPLYGMEKAYQDHYNQVILNMRSNYQVTFRAYDQGVAYRFSTSEKGMVQVINEEAHFNFASDPQLIGLISDEFHQYEENYQKTNLAALASEKIVCLPVLAKMNNGTNVIITEADLMDYPGLYLQKNPEENGFQSLFPPYPIKEEVGGDRNFNVVVLETAEYIAETAGSRNFPWRLIGFTDSDHELLENHFTYLLASPSTIADPSWINPGKVAWDWYNNLNLTGVDFKSGFNTESYKYFIDFAAENDIEYVNLDEGWSNQFDLFDLADDLDMMELVNYANQKGVGLFLWVIWHVLDQQLVPALDQFQKWGIAGIKVDFMNRDDQKAVRYYERVSREAAKRNILVNFHGAYKPTGIRRTYPNLINREAVLGLEFNKFSDKQNPDHEVTIPFIRMYAGPMDFTPGAMNNATKENFKINFTNVMSKGTRAHQLGMYVVYYGPLQMLADAPTAYEKEPDILQFLSEVPTIWDETLPLQGEVGEYVVMARRQGNDWYVGGMTGWNPREINLKFDFLEHGKSYQAYLLKDGINADKNPEDYVKEEWQIQADDELTIQMMPGGGFAIQLKGND